MHITLWQAIRQAVQGFSETSNQTLLMDTLQKICDDFGLKARVSTVPAKISDKAGGTQILITFSSNEEAIHFANSARTSTYGFNSVLLSFD